MPAKSLAITAAVLALGLTAACATAQTDPASVTTATAAPATIFASDRISVTSVGAGPDVVLIPGLGSSPKAWESTVAAMPGYRFHLIQVAGFAGTPPGGNASGPVLAPVADEIARYIRSQGLSGAALAGHSMGGSLAMQVAIRHPGLAGRVMVGDMMPFVGVMFGPPGTTAQSVEPVAATVRGALAGMAPAVRQSQTEATINGMVRTEALRPVALADSLSSDPAVSAQAMYDLITTDMTADLARITVPLTVLYVTPTGSPLSDAQLDTYYQIAYSAAPALTLARVPDSAHFIMWDNPGVFLAALATFLRP